MTATAQGKRFATTGRQVLLLVLAIVLLETSCFTARTMSHHGDFRKDSHSLSSSSVTEVSNCESSSILTNMPDTLVVGGGLGGLAAAAALRSIAKIENVHVIESRVDDDVSNDCLGAAMQLGPNAFKALQAIGGTELLVKIYKEGTKLKENVIMLPGGAPPMRIPNMEEKETGYPTVLIRWGVLRRLLGEMLPEKNLLFGIGKDIAGYKLTNNEKESDELTSFVSPVDKDGQSVEVGSTFKPELIVGADGVRSVFRECINNDCTTQPDDAKSTIKDNGRMNIKATVPVELAELGDQFEVPQATFAQFNPQVACFAGPAGPGYTYWAISIPDAEDGTPFFSSCNPEDDKVHAKNLLLDKLEEEAGVGREWIIQLVERTDPFTILFNRSVEAPVEEHNSFVSKDGKVVLLGDAAHAMNPAYGQSASFAFEDAATLASCIRDGGDVPLNEALQLYSAKRVGRCMEMQRRSEERAAKAMRGEEAEDVSKWIYSWEV